MKASSPFVAALIALFSALSAADECTNKNLSILASTPPQYPAKACGQEGWVKIRILVAPNGHAHKVSVVESKPEGVFDLAAITAAESWKFNSHTETNRCGEYVLVFELDKSS
ncbi:energy transducer TonB [Permianibacter aggregans]|uniref:energy transducer TonB n=1 Tax=Permianibacter aggregans TaxID=1510150 RepID=UPI00105B664E|nr:energy transducer TonB [Permianibacter aggregans]QGX40123.1 energy transducer TonB [Permianibacter aggregans]